MTHATRTRTLLGILLASAVLALSACGGGDDSEKSSEEPTSEASEETPTDADEGALQPDLDGIPDVVAVVNGEEVTKDEFVPVYQAQFQQAAMQAQMSGQEPDEDALKEQTANNLVDTELLAQEAEARGIEVTDQDVETELGDLAERNQLDSAEALLAALEEQGTSEDVARTQLETQIRIERLVADEAGSADPSDKELRKIYQRAKTQQEQAAEQGAEQQKIPPFAKVKDQLKEQAKSEQVQKVARSLVDELREDADITLNL